MISIEEITEHYKKNFNKNVKQFAYRTSSTQDAEDIMQDCYERCVRYRNSFKEGESLDAWIGQIRYNCLKDHRKKERGFSFEEIEEDHFEGIPCNFYSAEMVEDILSYIHAEHADKEEILRLYFKFGYQVSDICACLGTLYPFTHQTVRRFKIDLQERFG